ncbi:flagellar basal body P-ring formation protein FlgA [bacterium AH-315-J21]|nr:flagellar basal body P-ring formation protein FlgA [bacterium AH-315-J21]
MIQVIKEKQNVIYRTKTRTKTVSASIRILLTLIAFLQVVLMMAPTRVQSVIAMNDFEKLVMEAVYDSSNLDKVHCLLSIRRNTFVNSDITNASIDSLRVRLLLTTEPKGLYPVIVYLYQNDGRERHGQVTLYAQRFDSVLTLKKKTRRGASSTLAITEIEFRDITKIVEEPLLSTNEMAGMQFRRNARAGEIITAEMLEQVPDIEPGDEVLIKYVRGALVLNARGKALGKGVIGETVRVRNLSSKKIIAATISGVGVVTIRAHSARR